MTALSDSRGTGLAPRVRADGADVPRAWTDALAELRVERGLRTIGRATLRFTDVGYALAERSAFVVGTEVEVTAAAFADREGSATIFQGEVSSVGVEQRYGRPPEIVVVAEDAAIRLARTSRARTFLGMAYSSIVQVLARDAGLRDDVEATRDALDYVLQTDSDLGFLDEIAERIGWDWQVEGRTLHFWSTWSGSGRTQTRGPDVRATLGDTLHEFSATVSASGPGTVQVRGWDPVNQKAVVGTARGTGRSAPDSLDKAFYRKGTDTSVLDAASRPTDDKEAGLIAQARSRAHGSVVARGRLAITPRLTPGGSVTVAGAGPASGTYLVQEVTHVYRANGFESRFVAGDRPVPRMAVSTEPTASFAHSGLVVGTVTSIKDEHKLGRVKVKFSGLSDEVESGWARVATIGAGKSRGVLALPEVGDEVLVGFEGGDTRRPVVLGGLYGKTTSVPDGTLGEGTVDARRITSRLGHVIELGDGTDPGTQHVRLALATDTHRLRIGKDRTDLAVPSGVPLKLSAGSSAIEMDGNGGITIEGTKITIKAQNAVEVSGLDVTAKASNKFAASGVMSEVKAGGNLDLQANGVTVVKGAMVKIN